MDKGHKHQNYLANKDQMKEKELPKSCCTIGCKQNQHNLQARSGTINEPNHMTSTARYYAARNHKKLTDIAARIPLGNLEWNCFVKSSSIFFLSAKHRTNMAIAVPPSIKSCIYHKTLSKRYNVFSPLVDNMAIDLTFSVKFFCYLSSSNHAINATINVILGKLTYLSWDKKYVWKFIQKNLFYKVWQLILTLTKC